jgi:hypothetical protein
VLHFKSEQSLKGSALSAKDKIVALKVLAQQRRESAAGTRENGYSRDYKHIEIFHAGYYDNDWPSPWTRSACNVDSPIVLVGQDWASERFLSRSPDAEMASLGHDPNLPTNKNLKYLLREAFGRELSDVFATNAFLFIKSDSMGTRIPLKDLQRSVETYTLHELQIVQPKMVLCLGTATLNGFRAALGYPARPLISASYTEPQVMFGKIEIYGVPHCGARGLNSTGGLSKSLKIWQRLAQRLSHL